MTVFTFVVFLPKHIIYVAAMHFSMIHQFGLQFGLEIHLDVNVLLYITNCMFVIGGDGRKQLSHCKRNPSLRTTGLRITKAIPLLYFAMLDTYCLLLMM